MNKKHIVGYGLTAIGFFGVGLAGGGGSAPATTSLSTETVTATAAAPTPASATVTVSPPTTTETHTVTQTVDAETVTETVEAEAVTETVTLGTPEPEEIIPGSGMFEVGVDIDPGTYVSEASGGCYWARLSGSDGFDSIIDNSFGEGQMIVTIKDSDRFFETNGCEPWARRSG